MSLQEWLDIATRDLCEDAKKRIVSETHSHFSTGYDNAVQAGARDEEANASALIALGDPKIARKRFKKLYFTSTELSVLNGLTRQRSTRSKLFWVIYLSFWIFILVWPGPAESPSNESILQVLQNSGNFLSLLSFFALPALLGNKLPRAVLAINLILLPPSLLSVATFMLFHSTGRGSEFALLAMRGYEVIGYQIAVVIIVLAVVIAVPYSWFICWSVLRKLRYKHNWELVRPDIGG